MKQSLFYGCPWNVLIIIIMTSTVIKRKSLEDAGFVLNADPPCQNFDDKEA